MRHPDAPAHPPSGGASPGGGRTASEASADPWWVIARLLAPVVLSVLLFCAHLVRSGLVLFIPPVLTTLALLFIKSGWTARFFQVELAFMTLAWLLSAAFSVSERVAAGQPWLRMALILLAVALFTLGSAVVFESPALRRLYPRRITF